MQIVDNDHKNNLMKFGKDSVHDEVGFQATVISILCKIGMAKFLKNLHISLIAKKLFFQKVTFF